MRPKAVALLSGGLDSMLAIAALKEQGVEMEAVYFQSMFGCCKDDARQAAHRLGVPFTMLKVGDDYLDLVENPKHGYGRGINPCVDCRGYMFEAAKKFMERAGASFLVSGEVLDQRPMSQKMKDFKVMEKDCGLEGKILRPLSAKRLPATEAEQRGWVDREQLFGIHGRSRKKLLELAARYGIEDPPMPSAGCALTSPLFAKKVRDVFDHHPGRQRWEFEILRIGRHFRLDTKAKAVVARNENQNAYFEVLHPAGTSLLSCENFGGPHALVIGECSEESLKTAGRLVLRYSQQKSLPETCEIRIEKDGESRSLTLPAKPLTETELEKLRIV